MPSLDLSSSLHLPFVSGDTGPRRVSLDGNVMPHVSDKKALRLAATELGTPIRMLRLQAGHRHLDLDAQPQDQREFQGLVLRCLSTPRMINPWDWSLGRSFYQLQSYTSWAAATADTFIISANTPQRVTAYLLPFTRETGDPRNRIAGIPGLRLLSITAGMILMRHLPTGGKLAIHNSPPAWMTDSHMANSLYRELRSVRRKQEGRPLFQLAEMTKYETYAFAAFHHHSELLAGLAARVGLWWSRGEEVSLHPDRGNSTLGMLSWQEPSPYEPILPKLTLPLAGVPGSQVVTGGSTDASSYLYLGEESLELDNQPNTDNISRCFDPLR
jgi:hypothetical protein